MNLDDILRCPQCRGELLARTDGYACGVCRVRYPVADGVPSFVPSDAVPLEADPAPPRAPPQR